MIDQKTTTNIIKLFPFLQDIKIQTDDLAPVKLSAGICAFTDGGESSTIPLLIRLS